MKCWLKALEGLEGGKRNPQTKTLGTVIGNGEEAHPRRKLFTPLPRYVAPDQNSHGCAHQDVGGEVLAGSDARDARGRGQRERRILHPGVVRIAAGKYGRSGPAQARVAREKGVAAV